MRPCVALVPLVLTAFVAGGCIGLGGAGARVDEMVVQVPPAATDWDNSPGPDGLEVTVHLFNYNEKPPVEARGALEFALYAGRVGQADLAEARPTHNWVFTADMLKSHLIRTPFGRGYAFQLGWGRSVPASTSITMLVRYTPSSGAAVSSNPITISMTPK